MHGVFVDMMPSFANHFIVSDSAHDSIVYLFYFNGIVVDVGLNVDCFHTHLCVCVSFRCGILRSVCVAHGI